MEIADTMNYDPNNKVSIEDYKFPATFRSVRLTVFLWIIIVTNAIDALSSLNDLTSNQLDSLSFLLLVISAAFSVFVIIFCIFMLKLKKGL